MFRGGLNDVFCQIERCWEYSIKTQRLLVVDSRDTHFSESLALYFKSTDPRIHLADDSFELDTADTYPRIPKYYREAADFSPEIGYITHSVTLHFP